MYVVNVEFVSVYTQAVLQDDSTCSDSRLSLSKFIQPPTQCTMAGEKTQDVKYLATVTVAYTYRCTLGYLKYTLNRCFVLFGIILTTKCAPSHLVMCMS